MKQQNHEETVSIISMQNIALLTYTACKLLTATTVKQNQECDKLESASETISQRGTNSTVWLILMPTQVSLNHTIRKVPKTGRMTQIVDLVIK
eukprot:13276544-Ditylum_brightwellii.AAC.1